MDPAVRRLRWVMVGVCLLDMACTLWGQPRGYWNHSDGANEANSLFKSMLMRGWMWYVLGAMVCILGLFVLVSVLRKRAGLIVLLSATMSCYFGACSWLVYDFRLGTAAEIVYAIVLAGMMVGTGLGGR